MSQRTIQPALIAAVMPNSIAEDVGFERGDRLVSINQQQPRDLIDYRFLCADDWLDLEVMDAAGAVHHVAIEKEADEDLGLEFETALFDGLMQCNNHCPFCFIDQQPPGKRQTLYLKDDDYRLSFLYGSYLTLTNLMAKEWDRIAAMRLSPLYVSVHATEPAVRSRLLKNSRAGEILQQLEWFQAQRLQIHAQVVLCPGINDGLHLDQTLQDLARFHHGEIPAVISVAVVPVGLTKFRPTEDELVPVSPQQASAIIAQVTDLQAQFLDKFDENFVWLADEWFLIAGQPLPPEAHYADYPQIGNGVGSIRLFLKEFEQAAHILTEKTVTPPRRLTWVVGNAVEKAFQPILARLNQVPGLTVQLRSLRSLYWGQDMTVTGLLTGYDLLEQLQGIDLGDGLLLPAVMLKHDEACFLDDIQLDDVIAQLGVPIYPVSGVEELIDRCLQGADD